MEVRETATLRELMSAHRIDLPQFFSIAMELTEWLSQLHHTGSLVRFVTPEKVMLQSHDGKWKLHAVQPDAPASSEAPAYIAPEQTGRMNREADQRSDLYALGVLFYELLTGELPFQADSLHELVHAHIAVLPAAPVVRNPSLPQTVNDLIVKLLAKEPEERYQSAYGLKADLLRGSDQLAKHGRIEPFPLGADDEKSRFRLPDRRYDRETEVQELLDAYGRIALGSVEVVLVGGHPGNGKTSLIQSLQAPIVQQQGYFISGKFEQIDRATPYAAILSAFRSLLRQILAGSAEELDGWRKKLTVALGRSGNVLTEVLPELPLIIGKEPPVKPLPPAEATFRFQTLFSHLIKGLADHSHPLVLWLDDLHWADLESLELLRFIMSDKSQRCLLVIGTYRESEFDEKPWLEKLLGHAEPQRPFPAVRLLRMKPLGYRAVIQYVAEVLHAVPNEIKPLAETLYQKTAGNPFYLKQLLQLLYDEKQLFFRTETASWEWDLQAIRERDSFTDVIGLIARRVGHLPEPTRLVLKTASCLGSSFAIQQLSLLMGLELDEALDALQPAVTEGLLIGRLDTYLFLHDQVQQAAYERLDEEEKRRIHYQIGCLLFCQDPKGETDEHLFETTFHLNAGSALLSDEAEIERLAELNLQAGRRAKAAAAYARALDFFRKGAALLAGDGWSKYEPLYTMLLLEGAECHYFCGDFRQAEKDLEQLLRRAEGPLERARIYGIQIAMYAFLKQDSKSAAIATQAITEFGMPFPTKPSLFSIASEVLQTQFALFRRMRRLTELPSSLNPSAQALADIIMASSAILFIDDEERATIILAKYVRLSLKRGYSHAFAGALGSYAVTVCFGLHRHRTALRLVETALTYAEKADHLLVNGQAHLYAALILQLLRPREAGRYFQQAADYCWEAGDRMQAGYAISSMLITERRDLCRLERLCLAYLERADAMDNMTLSVMHLTQQYVGLLQNGVSHGVSFRSEHFDEKLLLQWDLSNNAHRHHLHYYLTCKLEVQYLYGFYSEAVTVAEEAERFKAVTVLTFNQQHCFYWALAIMAVHQAASAPAKRRYRKRLGQLLAKMKRWTRIAPESTLSKYWLLLAEFKRIHGRNAQAEKWYDQSIQWAVETGLAQDEAIANELAASFHRQMGRKKEAEAYSRHAVAAYDRWGAFGKAASLRKHSPEWSSFALEEQHAAGNEAVAARELPTSELNQMIDMDTLRNLSAMVPKDIEQALEVFLSLALRNAGADKGVVLLSGQEGLEEAAEIDLDTGADAKKPVPYSTSVVQYVLRTREAVVLGRTGRGQFEADPYLAEAQPKSILCLPIRYPDSREGVLYLENSHTSDAFTPDRIDVLELLFSRTAYLQLLREEERPDGFAVKTAVQVRPFIIESLSHREIEIVRLMAQGLSNKEIAGRLSITEGTVKSHAFNIYGKLQVGRRVQAIAKARELKLID